jgi:hypothetical protein
MVRSSGGGHHGGGILFTYDQARFDYLCPKGKWKINTGFN